MMIFKELLADNWWFHIIHFPRCFCPGLVLMDALMQTGEMMADFLDRYVTSGIDQLLV